MCSREMTNTLQSASIIPRTAEPAGSCPHPQPCHSPGQHEVDPVYHSPQTGPDVSRTSMREARILVVRVPLGQSQEGYTRKTERKSVMPYPNFNNTPRRRDSARRSGWTFKIPHINEGAKIVDTTPMLTGRDTALTAKSTHDVRLDMSTGKGPKAQRSGIVTQAPSSQHSVDKNTERLSDIRKTYTPNTQVEPTKRVPSSHRITKRDLESKVLSKVSIVRISTEISDRPIAPKNIRLNGGDTEKLGETSNDRYMPQCACRRMWIGAIDGQAPGRKGERTDEVMMGERRNKERKAWHTKLETQENQRKIERRTRRSRSDEVHVVEERPKTAKAHHEKDIPYPPSCVQTRFESLCSTNPRRIDDPLDEQGRRSHLQPANEKDIATHAHRTHLNRPDQVKLQQTTFAICPTVKTTTSPAFISNHTRLLTRWNVGTLEHRCAPHVHRKRTATAHTLLQERLQHLFHARQVVKRSSLLASPSLVEKQGEVDDDGNDDGAEERMRGNALPCSTHHSWG
ncbi:hypothetical protein DFP72DRAFT_1142686 [Ephemerocybe angulata]|uniref:Uncharacterized protein n=1 Tax=Ephemerocybe angulata TaxID=980116 RepID=A0A8H6LZY8_9AGAR|nr:hypothetical protein DFP72DRAFT_1142686 [Tulosesus angulatus]